MQGGDPRPLKLAFWVGNVGDFRGVVYTFLVDPIAISIYTTISSSKSGGVYGFCVLVQSISIDTGCEVPFYRGPIFRGFGVGEQGVVYKGGVIMFRYKAFTHSNALTHVPTQGELFIGPTKLLLFE